jgi:DNA (cytosine-5)-methyltransferase 1
MMAKLKVISLFSGAGGLDLGFKSAGCEIFLATDTMRESCDTLRDNNSKLAVY